MRYLLTACLCSLFLLVAFNLPVHFEVSGKITDEKGAPIPGASILIKGTTTGTTTFKDGTFKLTVNSNKATLIFSCAGYNVLEMEVSPKNISVAIVLTENKNKLSEVIVTSLGISKQRKRLTNAPYPSKSISNGFYNNSLEGKVAGVIINGTNGAPGSSTDVNRRDKYAIKDDDGLSREGYDAITENRFLKVTDNPLSTFSIDVDAASYSNVRRMLTDGQLPPAGAVRIEEMINYFKYEYPQPQNEHPFSINTEIADCPWNNNHKLVLIGLQGKQIEMEKLPPSNIVFLIDVSGSMQDENKLPLVKQSIKLLVDQLREEDKISIVVYAGNAGLVLPSANGDEKMKIKSALEELEAGGSTAGGEGIQLAYKIANQNFIKEGNNRIILCTDGDFNIGVSSDDGLERMIEKERKSGVFLTVLGYGMGNYQDAKMQKLADKGNGNHAYIDNLKEAQKVLVSEFGGTLFTIAKDVKLQIEFNPANVQGYRLIGYENRMLNKEDFNNDKKDAGELGSGQTVTALYEVIPAGIQSKFLEKVDPLKYQLQNKIIAPAGGELMTIKFRHKKINEDKSQLIEHTVINNPILFLNTSTNFRFAAAVAQFGMLLRDSEFKQGSTFENTWKMAQGAIGKDKEGYRAEFLDLIKNAQALAVAKNETIKNRTPKQ